MRILTSGTVTRLQTIQESAMTDKCEIIRYFNATGSYGENVPTVTGTFETMCGFQFVGGEVKDRQGAVTLVEYDGILRLPLDQSILLTDQIHLTRKGYKVTDLYFYPYEQPQLSNSVQKLHVKKVTTNGQ